MNSLGLRIITARKMKDINQYGLAERLGISVQSLIRYEKDRRVPDADLMGKIAAELGVDVAWLMAEAEAVEGGAEPAPPPEVAEERATFSLGVRAEVARHNRAIIERMLGQIGRIFDEGDYRKTGALQSMLDVMDPGENKG